MKSLGCSDYMPKCKNLIGWFKAVKLLNFSYLNIPCTL
jgi:hypothetical protein